MLNINVGILGHVDSGKTTLSKALSDVSSTAAFDKSPQSQERGITLDLGFSGMFVDIPKHLQDKTSALQLQFTFVDCPGHAKLIKTIIGGAQIIDLMLLVIDIQKGIQEQTMECLVIGEVIRKQVIVVLNKIDLIEENKQTVKVNKFIEKFKLFLKGTTLENVKFVALSAANKTNTNELKELLISNAFVPHRDLAVPFLFAADHCFSIKGHGSVCTGTVLQGRIKINDVIEVPQVNEVRRIKTIQVFKKPVDEAKPGDRIGICITQFNTELIERGILSAPGYLKLIKGAIIRVNRIKLHKWKIQSKSKFHIAVGYENLLAKITLFTSSKVDGTDEANRFDWNEDYEYIPEICNENIDENLHSDNILAYLEFEKPIFIAPNSLLIGLRLNTGSQANQCRLAFWSHLNYVIEQKDNVAVNNIKLFKFREKFGQIQKFVSKTEAISRDLFKTDSERRLFLNKEVRLSTGEIGIVDSPFGATTKVKIKFLNDVADTTIEMHSQINNFLQIILKYKKYLNK